MTKEELQHKRFIAKPGGWFDKGVEVKLLQSFHSHGDDLGFALFAGMRNGEEDEEICVFDEFDVSDAEVVNS